MRVERNARTSLVALIVALVAIQVVPVDRTNPPVETEIPVPAEVRSILRRACYDCHSNETVWPWYSRIAPSAWLVASDVHEGRDELNFSTWNRMTTDAQAKAIHKSWQEVQEGGMPPWAYLLPHPDARLSAEDRSVLEKWSRSAGGGDPIEH